MVGLNAMYWKPIQSGLEGITDTDWVRDKTGLPSIHFHSETYRLRLPLSPHAAADHDGLRINLEDFIAPAIDENDHLIVEGAGGVMVPLNETRFMSDLMKKLDLPVLLVASNSLGTINHTLLSLEQLSRNGLDVMGVVLNGPKNSINREAIEHYSGVKVLAEIEPLAEINPQSLSDCFNVNFS
jgi:dethiobiotin synthase